jgi:hypothetical protein
MIYKVRRLNKHFQDAINLVSTFSYLKYESLDECYKRLKLYADEYYYDTNDKIIFIECEYHKDEPLIKIPYINRFSDKYLKRINFKLYKLYNSLEQYKEALFITLTVDPNNFNNPKMMYKALSQAWNKLATILRKKGITKYIKTVEYTASHIPHLHVMLFHSDWIDVNWLRNLWQKYGIAMILRLEYIKTTYKVTDKGTKASYPISYIWKYITKTYEPDDDNNKGDNNKKEITKIWQWALRARAFSISKELVSLIKDKTNSNFATLYLKFVICMGLKDIIEQLKKKHKYNYVIALPINLATNIEYPEQLRSFLNNYGHY